MSKKERMLSHIQNNAQWFMSTDTFRVIPYTDLTYSLFETAKQNIAWDAEYDDVVCLISTSILSDGKSGVLFTTEYVYTKSWGGPFTSSYKRALWTSYSAEFSDYCNEFYVSRMQEMMSDLFNIANEENEKERKQAEIAERLEKLGDIGQAVAFLLLTGMATVEIIAHVSDALVDSNNDEILDEINDILSEYNGLMN